MRLVDIDALRDRIDALEMLSTFKDSLSWPTYVHRTNEIDDVLDEAPVVMQWNKPSEELPFWFKTILFVVNGDLYLGDVNEFERFVPFKYDGQPMEFSEDEVSAWCYAPSLPEWCEEE